MYGLHEIHIGFLIDDCLQLDTFLVCAEQKHLKCLIDNVWKTEIVLSKLEGVILHFSKVQNIVDQIFQHLLWENLPLKESVAIWRFESKPIPLPKKLFSFTPTPKELPEVPTPAWA